MELNSYICHKEVVNCGYLFIGPSESHPSPLGWEMLDASSQVPARSLPDPCQVPASFGDQETYRFNVVETDVNK